MKQLELNRRDSAPRPTQGRRAVRRSRLAVVFTASALCLILAACSSNSKGASSSSSGGSSGSSAPAVIQNVSYAYPAAGVQTLTALVMQDNPGMCAQFGVKPTLTLLAPGTATPAVAAGQQNFTSGASTSFLLAALKDPTSAKIVGMETGGQPALFFGAKNINSVADLKGKTVAATSSGSATDISARELLSQAGLTVGKDVQLTYSGAVAALYGLALAGTISAFVFTSPLQADVTAAGFHSIADAKNNAALAPIWRTVVTANSQFAKDHPAAVKGFLQCYAAAQKVASTDMKKDTDLLLANNVTAADAAAQLATLQPFGLTKFPPTDVKTITDLLTKNKVADFGTTDLSSTVDNSFIS